MKHNKRFFGNFVDGMRSGYCDGGYCYGSDALIHNPKTRVLTFNKHWTQFECFA